MSANDGRDRPGIDGNRAIRIVVPTAAVLLTALGLVLIFVARGEETFGWFPYAPLSDITFPSGDLVFLPNSARIGIALTALGLVVLAFWSGFRTGSRRR